MKATDNENASLTRREIEVLSLAATGIGSRAVADGLCISKRTVDFHLASAYRKLDAPNRIMAILAAKQQGILA